MKISHSLFALAGAALLLEVPAGAQASSEPRPNVAQTATADGQERRICRRIQETGSLARRRRQCYTRAEWDRIAEAARQNGQRLQDDMRSAPSSN